MGHTRLGIGLPVICWGKKARRVALQSGLSCPFGAIHLLAPHKADGACSCERESRDFSSRRKGFPQGKAKAPPLSQFLILPM